MSKEIELITNPKLRAKHMNRVEVLDRVGDLKTLPKTKFSTTKQIAEFYGVKSQAINIAIGLNRNEVQDAGVKQANYRDLKEILFNVAGSGVIWKEMRTNLGIATSVTNLYSKQAVVLIGFMLEGSEVAEKVRKLVLNEDDEDFYIPVEPTIQKQHNYMRIVNHNEQLVIDSRDVADMVGKRHDNVMRDITTIISHLEGQLKIEESYFKESTYTNNQNKQQPCYLLTKKGCELFATRMTGAKGTQFAVTYIEKFNQMEEQLKSQVIIPVASYMIDDPIKRAEQWISEQREKMLLEDKVQKQVELIEYKQEIINSFTEEITLAEQRQFLIKIIRKGCYNSYQITQRWNILYDQFDMKYHKRVRTLTKNYNLANGKKLSVLDYIENHLGMLKELYELALKWFASDVEAIKDEYEKALTVN